MRSTESTGGPMLISDEHMFLVALPTKCGTNSMRNMAAAWERDGGNPLVLREIPALRHRMDVPAGCEDYRRAIIVRNPYDRLVSAFQYLLHHANEWKTSELNHRLEAEFDGDDRKLFAWWLRDLREERERANAKRARLDRTSALLAASHGRRPYIWTDRLSELSLHFGGYDITQPVSFPKDRVVRRAHGMWSVQTVHFLKLENLHRDWHRFLRTAGVRGGIDGLDVPHHNRASVRSSVYGVGGSYTSWYKNKGIRSLANELVGQDPELYGYSVL